MVCPKCGSENVTDQVMQEQTGSKSKTTKHGCMWQLCIGWWIWLIPHRKNKGITKTKNTYKYRTVFTCQNCGHTWKK